MLTETPTRRWIGRAAPTAILPLLLIAITVFVHWFAIETAGFDRNGVALMVYHASRLILFGYLVLLCYAAGYWAFELTGLSPTTFLNDSRTRFIACFFHGASLYGIAFTVLGLAGLVTTSTALALTVPVLIVGYRPLGTLVRDLPGALHAVRADAHASPLATALVGIVAAGAALLFVLLRAGYIPVFDPNIWEHYLHYYRTVLASGSTQPNEVWHHFYASKAAGLIFLASALSDVFGAQLANACFMAMAGVIILDLLIAQCESATWAVFGAALYFVFLCGQLEDGATFKHHGMLLGYISFALWVIVKLQQRDHPRRKPLLVSLVVSLAYLGFYLPPMAVILPPTFVLLVLVNAELRRRWPIPFLLACSVCLGAALAFGTNWALTGLAELTPARWFWTIADQAKFTNVFGTGGIEFFLGANNDLATEYDWSLKRTWRVLRYPIPELVIYYAALLGLLVVVIRKHVPEPIGRSARFLAILLAFTAPLGAFAQAFQTAAVDRMALYSIVFTTLASVVMLKALLDVAFGGRRFARAGMLTARHATLAVMGGAMAVVVTQQWKLVASEERPIIYRYLSGATSLEETFHQVEAELHPEATGIGVLDMAQFRKSIGPADRILRLTYDAGFSYALPGNGIVSEPTYALISNPRRLLTQPPHEVADYLRRQRINYFTLKLQSRLFTTVAFTSLFGPDEMRSELRVVYKDGDFYILTWRDNPRGTPVPDDVVRLFELKRAGALHYPFTGSFRDVLSKGGQRSVSDAAGFDSVRNEFQSDVDHAFRTHVLSLVSSTTSRALLERVLRAGQDAIVAMNPTTTREEALRARYPGDGDEEDQALPPDISETELRARFLETFRGAIFNRFEVEVGPVLASMSRACDERVPFAIYFPSNATC